MGKGKLSAGQHCRACLETSEHQMYSLASDLVTILNKDQTRAERVKLSEIYDACTQTRCEQMNPNWELICQDCHEKLIKFYEFRDMCIESFIRIKTVERFSGKQPENSEMGFKVEVVETAPVFEPDTIVSENDHFEYQERTSNMSGKMEIESEDDEINDNKDDETTRYETRSKKSQTCKQECDETPAKSLAENLEMASRDCDDDDDYDVENDENDTEDDDDEYTENVISPYSDFGRKVDLPNKRKKTKNAAKTNKSSPMEWNHICDICSKKFFKKHRYDAHMRKHLGLKQWKCDHCDRAFEKYTSLTLHITANHTEGEKPVFACDVDGCDKSYSMKESLRVHIRKVHDGQNPILSTKICEQCGKSFNNNAALIRHSYTHTKETPYKCDVCSKMFATKYKLKEHTMRHNGIKNFVCPTCGLRKTTGHELRVHMKYHNEDIQFPCKLCSLVFTRQANINRHMKVVHCGIKAFPCPHCDRSFGKAETLKHHVMTHTGERPLACTVCDKRFIQPIALKTHMKIHNKMK